MMFKLHTVIFLTSDLSRDIEQLPFLRHNTLKAAAAAANVLWDYTVKSLPMSAGRSVTCLSVKSDKNSKLGRQLQCLL